MSELTGPVIVIDDNTEAAKNLLASIQSLGWQCLSAKKLDQLEELCSDPFNQPLVMTAQFLQMQKLENDSLSNFFSHYLAVIALDDQSAGQETYYFRLGASDILEPNLDQRDISSVFKRLSKPLRHGVISNSMVSA